MAMLERSAMSPVVKMTSIRAAPRSFSAPMLLLLSRLVGSRGDDDEGFQLEEALFANAFDVHEFFNFLEAPVFLSVLDDALRYRASNAGKIVELIDRRGIEVDGGFGERRGSRLH